MEGEEASRKDEKPVQRPQIGSTLGMPNEHKGG